MTRLLLCTVTILALTASANAQSSYFGGNTQVDQAQRVYMGNPCTWSINRSGCNKAPQRAQPQRIKQPRR
jgi:hypothetical protein